MESSCHKRQVAIPLPSIPAQQPAVTEPPPTSPPPEASQQQPEPPVSAPPAPTPAAPVPAAPTPPVPAPAAPSSAPARRPARPTTAPPLGPSVPAASPDSQAPPPRLGDVLSADQQRQLNGAIDQSLSRAQASLNAVGNRQLSKDQQAVVGQVRNFIQQAQKLRSSNLPAAKSLAERAEVLARDFAASLR